MNLKNKFINVINKIYLNKLAVFFVMVLFIMTGVVEATPKMNAFGASSIEEDVTIFQQRRWTTRTNVNIIVYRFAI